MKPAPFSYEAPTSIEKTLDLLDQSDGAARIIAGGQSLLPMLAMRLAQFDVLIDVNGVAGLDVVEVRDGMLTIGAMVRQAHVERDPITAKLTPLLAEATRLIGHFQIRNRGTIGGSLANADPAAEYPAVALALDAELEVVNSGGMRRIAAADFFRGHWMTAMEDNELLTAVHIPVPRQGHGWSVKEMARRAGDFALAGVACQVETDSARAVSEASFGLFGMGDRPLRLPGLEQALRGAQSKDDISSTVTDALLALHPIDDMHASSSYRRDVCAHLIVLALQEALDRAHPASQ